MPRKVHLLIMAIALHLAAAQSPNLPLANISGSFYGLPQRNELHLKTSQTVQIELTNIEFDGSLQSDDVRKYNLVRSVINGAPGFAHGLNANRELQISDFQVRLAAALLNALYAHFQRCSACTSRATHAGTAGMASFTRRTVDSS